MEISMKRYRLLYIGILLANLIITFFFNSLYIMVINFIMLIIPCIFYLLLRRQVSAMLVELDVPYSGYTGRELDISVLLKSKKAYQAVGMMDVYIRIFNTMFEEESIHKIRIACNKKSNRYVYTFLPELCGQIKFECEKIVCTDALGIFTKKLKTSITGTTIVYPGARTLNVVREKQPQGYIPGASYYQERKGNDAGEVYDMREYNPGDDIRHVHWKLSSKHEEIIYREMSEPSNYYTMLLFDAGTGLDITKKMQQMAVSISISISEQLVYMGHAHYIGIPTSGGIYGVAVRESSDYSKMMEEWMGIPITEEAGAGIKYFLADNLEMRYTKLIYVTAGIYPRELEHVADNMNVTVVCVTKEGDAIRSTESNGCWIVELPIGLSYDSVLNITI